jgi:tetrahydromethanopterin S-methyltransferase subunit C
MLNMRVTVGIGVTVVFLAWTSSKVLYVLRVMKEIVGWIVGWIVGRIVGRINYQIWKIRMYFR